jgi:uncharacterized protein YbaR (Trm112 family)
MTDTNNNTKECSICLESDNLPYFIDLSCGHSFHQYCIGEWFTKKLDILICPYCNQKDTNILIFDCILQNKVYSSSIKHKQERIIIFISPKCSVRDLVYRLAITVHLPPHKMILNINNITTINTKNISTINTYTTNQLNNLFYKLIL